MKAGRAALRGWADLLHPSTLSLVAAGAGLTLVLFVVLQAVVFWAVRRFLPGDLALPWIGTIDFGQVMSWGSLALFPVMGFFLMAPVAAGFSGLFAERVADRVEAMHYPAARGRSVDALDGFLESLAVVAAAIGIAVATLIATPFLGPLAPLVFFGANGWLLGREFFQMAARRHLDTEAATALRRRNGAQVTLLGVLIAVALVVPVVNIAVPLLAAAAFTHLFHLISGSTGPDARYPRG